MSVYNRFSFRNGVRLPGGNLSVTIFSHIISATRLVRVATLKTHHLSV